VRQATTTYPFGVLKIKTTNKTFKIKKISYISEVVFFLNHIISNPIKLEMLTNINPEVVTSEMYGVFASKFSFGRTYYFGKKAKEEDKEFESDFIKKIDAILSFSK